MLKQPKTKTIGFPLTLIETQAYVLLQVRKKDANHSAVDALVHKTVSSDKFDKFAKKMKKWKERDKTSEAHFHSVDSITTNITFGLEPTYKANNALKEETNGQMDAQEIPDRREKEPKFKDVLSMIRRRFAKGSVGPNPSQSEGFVFKPETVQLNNGHYAVYKVRPDNLVSALQDLLSSVTLRKYLDKLSRKSAVVYRTVKDDAISNILRMNLF